MKFSSLDARRVADDFPISDYQEGDYSIRPKLKSWGDEPVFDDNHWVMYVRCPGCREVIRCDLSQDPQEDPRRGYEGTYWYWNGDYDKPTLKPSIGVTHHEDKGRWRWHGFLTNGRLEACE